MAVTGIVAANVPDINLISQSINLNSGHVNNPGMVTLSMDVMKPEDDPTRAGGMKTKKMMSYFKRKSNDNDDDNGRISTT